MDSFDLMQKVKAFIAKISNGEWTVIETDYRNTIFDDNKVQEEYTIWIEKDNDPDKSDNC